MLFEFILFAIIGWTIFGPTPPKVVLLVIFVVLMVLWAIVGFTGYDYMGHLRVPH